MEKIIFIGGQFGDCKLDINYCKQVGITLNWLSRTIFEHCSVECPIEDRICGYVSLTGDELDTMLCDVWLCELGFNLDFPCMNYIDQEDLDGLAKKIEDNFEADGKYIIKLYAKDHPSGGANPSIEVTVYSPTPLN